MLFWYKMSVSGADRLENEIPKGTLLAILEQAGLKIG
jgi:hypothetical protein